MNEYNGKLIQLIFGDRNVFVFDYINKRVTTNEDRKTKTIFNIITSLEKSGYRITNTQVLFSFSFNELLLFKENFAELIHTNTKEGIIFRKTFANEEKFSDYSSEEWSAMFAQYAITYGWSKDYENIFGNSPEQNLNDYVGGFDLTEINNVDNAKLKEFSIGNEHDLELIIKNILESKSVLRNQQLKVLEECPKNTLLNAAKNSNIIIKETLIKTMKLLSSTKIDFPLLKTANDVLRFIVANYAENNIDGKFDGSDLAKTKIHIPTSIRKVLLNNLEMISKKKAIGSTEGLPKELCIMDAINLKGSRYLTEDMFLHSKFWKIIDKYLRYTNSKRTRELFPYYTKAIDLLYEDDRSWTFNGRFAKAKKDLDYEKAIMIAKERPGFLLRNLVEFLRMVRNALIPVKQKEGFQRNAFQDLLNDKVDCELKRVKTDGIEFILSEEFKRLLSEKANTKLCWQLIELLKDKKLFEEIHERVVQGKTQNYYIPIPAMNKKLAKKVRKILISVIRRRHREDIEQFDKIYIDSNAKGQTLQYSGRNSTEISYAGEFLTPGTELELSDLLNKKECIDPILRIGIAWRGKRSVDLDHSLTSDKNTIVYFSKPVLKLNDGYNTEIIATSSGDITTCSNDKFSVEFVDVDLIKAKEFGFSSFFNSVIVYSGGSKIGDLECYTFFSVIEKSKRIIKGQRVSIDLSKQDYSIRIDPENKEKSESYLGCNIDLNKGTIKALNIPIKGSNSVTSTALKNNNIFRQELEKSKINGITIGYALKKMFGKDNITDDISEADLVISRNEPEPAVAKFGATVLHPGRDIEVINKLLF